MAGEVAYQADADMVVWQDKKRYLWLLGLIAPTALLVILPIVWAMNRVGWHTASQALFWIGPILLYIVLPALDLRFGPDGQNPPDEVMGRLENDRYYRYCTYLYVPFQYVSVVVGATVEEAFFACTFLEENAQIQLQAEIAGGAIPLSDEEARDCAEGTFNSRLFPLLWAFYERKVALG